MFFYFALIGALTIWLRSLTVDKRERYQDTAVAIGLIVFTLLMTWPEQATTYLHPHTMDAAFAATDKWLHLDAAATGIWVYAHFAWFAHLLEAVYYALPLMMAGAYAIERNLMIPRTALFGGIAAYPFYNLYPAVGPAHAFSGIGPRNCMPSMHFSWALLVAINCKNPWLKAGAWTFFALTAMSTIVCGEHYFIDLFAAVPFCYAVQAISKEFHAVAKKIQPAAAYR